MVLRELFIKLGLTVDEAAFAKGELAAGLLKAGLEKIVDAAKEMAEQFIDTVKETVEYGGKTKEAAASAGVAAEALQQLQYAASRSDVSVEELNGSLGFLTRTMNQAKEGGKEQAKVFAQIGVKYKEANGQLRDASDVMEDVADHFESLPDGAAKSALAMQLFGRAGAKMIPLLNAGSNGLSDLRREADELGLVMGDSALEASEDINASLSRLRATSTGLWRGAIAPLLPAISELVKRFLAWRRANADVMKQRLQQFIKGGIVAIEALGKAFSVVIEVISRTSNVIKNHWQGALIAATAALAPFIVSLVAAGVAAIGTALGMAAAAAPFIAIGAAIAGVVALLDDVDTFKAVEKWNKLHPDKQLDPKKFSLLGRYQDAINEWMKPHVGDPWWLTAIKSAVKALEKALGLTRQLGWSGDGTTDSAQPGHVRGEAAAGGATPYIRGSKIEFKNDVASDSWLGRAQAWAADFDARHPVRSSAPSYSAPAGAGSVYAPTNRVEMHFHGSPEENYVMAKRAASEVMGVAFDDAAAARPATE